MPNFYETHMGHQFFRQQLPDLIKAVKSLADEMKKARKTEEQIAKDVDEEVQFQMDLVNRRMAKVERERDGLRAAIVVMRGEQACDWEDSGRTTPSGKIIFKCTRCDKESTTPVDGYHEPCLFDPITNDEGDEIKEEVSCAELDDLIAISTSYELQSARVNNALKEARADGRVRVMSTSPLRIGAPKARKEEWTMTDGSPRERMDSSSPEEV